jgi:hypothetical protein
MVVDGIHHKVVWKKFVVGSSFFVPCIHTEICKRDVKETMDTLQMKVVMKLVIEDGIRGLRIWRVK